MDGATPLVLVAAPSLRNLGVRNRPGALILLRFQGRPDFSPGPGNQTWEYRDRAVRVEVCFGSSKGDHKRDGATIERTKVNGLEVVGLCSIYMWDREKEPTLYQGRLRAVSALQGRVSAAA